MASSSLIKEAAEEIDLSTLFRGAEDTAPRAPGGGPVKVLDEEPNIPDLLSPPELDIRRGAVEFTKQEAQEALKYADSLDYDELGDVEFVMSGSKVPRQGSEALYQWYDEVEVMSPAPIKSPVRTSDNRVTPTGRNDRPIDEFEAQDIQMLLDNRRFYPDRIFEEGQSEKLWDYIGDDFIADAEGNPIVLFRTGSELGPMGFPRAFTGGNEFSAHFGTRSAALNLDDAATPGFGDVDKVVDIYYTNVKSPFKLPDITQWYSESVLSAVLRNTQADEGMKRKLLAVQRDYEEAARVVLESKGLDTTGSTLNEMMLELNEFNGTGLERTQTTLRSAMARDIKEVMKESGYDSLMYRNQHEGKGSMSFLPFEPNQVKSIKNIGTFNKRNENVLKSILGGTVVGTGAATQEQQEGAM